MHKGFVHSIESFGSVDGPGIRFLIFLQGCPMRCQFCHNPDSWKTGVGEEWSADDLLDKAERFKSYWGDKGGITVSGGEALMQIDFLIELFEKAHQRGINTCLDTSAQPFRKEGEFFEMLEREDGVPRWAMTNRLDAARVNATYSRLRLSTQFCRCSSL